MVSSKPAKVSVVRDGKKVAVAGFEVVFEDTILFPEGGGQVRIKPVKLLGLFDVIWWIGSLIKIDSSLQPMLSKCLLLFKK